MIVCLSGKEGDDDCPDDEREPRERVSPNERPSPTQTVDEPNAERFADERDDGVARLQTERGRGVDADALEDARSVVLDDAYARHLDTIRCVPPQSPIIR